MRRWWQNFLIFTYNAMNRLRYTHEQILAALSHTKGMRHLAAKQLGCSYRTLANYLARSPALRQQADDCRGELVDQAELKLREAVERGERWAVVLTLTTLGKDRGYCTRQEVQIPDPDRGSRNGHHGISEETAMEIRRKILGIPE